MNAKEISLLRKSGRLQEAMDAAETEFNTFQSHYSAGALFWCLNDFAKQSHGDALRDIVDRMQELCGEYCPDDKYMLDALQRIQKQMLPHASELRKFVDDAKNGGDAVAMCEVVSAYFCNNDLDPRLHNNYGWLIYYALKKIDLNDYYNRKKLLARYLSLELERPSLLHSLILGEAVKVEKNTPLQFRIRDFIRMWGLENLRGDDWKQFTTDKGLTLPSTVEQLISVYAKEIKTDEVMPSEEFSTLLDKALDVFKNNQNLPYYKATILIAQGRKAEAVGYYKKLITSNPSKFYLWDQLAELVDDENVAIALRCKAVSLGTDDEYIVNVRLRLANQFAAKGMLPNAKYELEKHRGAYESQGWRLKQTYFDVANLIPANVEAADNRSIYKKYFPYAEEFIYSALPSSIAVKEREKMVNDMHKPGKRFVVWTLRIDARTITLKKPEKLGLDRRTPNGKLLEIKEMNGKVVWAKPFDGPFECQWIKTVTGIVSKRCDRIGNEYAIVDDTYVGANLLKDVAEGSFITVIAVRRDDRRWSAIALG